MFVVKRKTTLEVILKFLFCDRDQKTQKTETILNLTWFSPQKAIYFPRKGRSVSQKNRNIMDKQVFGTSPQLGLRCRKSKCVFERAVNTIFTEFRQTKIKVPKKKEKTYPVCLQVLRNKKHHFASDQNTFVCLISVGRKIKKGIKCIYI